MDIRAALDKRTMLPLLSMIEDASPREVATLSREEMRELQRALHLLGYNPGKVDGWWGVRTQTAWEDFKEDESQSRPELIGKGSVALLKKRLAPPDPATGKSDGIIHNFSTRQGTVNAIKWECRKQGLSLPSQIAYVLATVQHETANTFRPIAEYGKGRGRAYGRPDPKTGQTYYGRGYVQLTWKSNYQKYSRVLGVDLVNNPNLAMDANVALFILVHGFKTGAFTGKKLTDYVNSQKRDWIGARRCINGTDKARLIADLAADWLKLL